MRDMKEPSIRRAEIMTAALRLFTSKGYLNTTTQDIIDQLKISRGLLYYHFKNKEDILFCLVEKFSQPLLFQLNTLAYAKEYTAIEKVGKFIEMTIISPAEITEEKKGLQQSINLEENRYMLDRFYHKMANTITIYFSHIIEQGNQEGTFHVSHPMETSEFLMTGYTFVSNDVKIKCKNDKELEQYLTSFKKILERTLGVSEPIFP